jgi:AAA ATPase domain
VAELFARIDSDPSQLVLWRQGRSLPYGDGVTFWALSEMVKAQAGILETDGEQVAGEKLDAAVASLIADPGDAQWISSHLRPLAGVSTVAEPAGDRRDEAFTAWRRFFEALSEQNPLVLVFEDLHWADDNLLDFVEHLVDWAGGVPMLVVCNTRPELFERRPGWAGNTRNAVKISLAPLSDDETSLLLSSLSERPVMPVETQQALLARAGGNPLYAEQYVRMLAERGDGEELPLPETVQGIIAARLDALSVEEKGLLQNAAVLGKVFWLVPARSIAARRSGSRRSAGRRTTRRCSLTTTQAHSSFAAPQARPLTRRLLRALWTVCVTPVSARTHSTRMRQRLVSLRWQSNWRHQDPLTARACSSASASRATWRAFWIRRRLPQQARSFWHAATATLLPRPRWCCAKSNGFVAPRTRRSSTSIVPVNLSMPASRLALRHT